MASGEDVTNWGARRWAAAAIGAAAVALILGLPTELVPNGVFARSVTPPTWWHYPVWIATSVLSGLLIATYVRQRGRPEPTGEGREGFATVLAFFAIGCPVCNKLVVLALGSTGALTWFGPVQPVLGVVALVLLAAALRARLRGEQACTVGAAAR